MNIQSLVAALLLILAFTQSLHAAVTIRCVPTLENASIYIEGTTLDHEALFIEYKLPNAETWTRGHSLTSSSNDKTPRTSIFGLTPNTSYEVRCLSREQKEIAKTMFTTWADTVPISKVIPLSTLEKVNGAYVIPESGTEHGWIKYTGDPQQTIHGGNEEKQAVLIEEKNHVIIENATITGGKRHGIALVRSQHIRIINCDISGYGRVGIQDFTKDGKFYDQNGKSINYDAGIQIWDSEFILVEHCFIHDPRNRANSWKYAHPEGPNAIFVKAKGNIVIRYNDFIGSNQHRWNDIIEGYGNSKVNGGFNRDSDIYGNYFSFANDDGIELDGGQCNVRVYGNKIEGCLCGISTAPNLRGPSFVHRNLIVNLGDERGSAGSAIKNGGGSSHTKGKTFFYHNTFFTHGNGISSVGFGKSKNRSMFYGHSRNNLLCVSGPGVKSQWTTEESDFDHDFFATPTGKPGRYTAATEIEANAKKAAAQFINASEGNFDLASESPAQTGTVAVSGFNQLSQYGANPKAFANKMLPMRPIKVSVDKQQLHIQHQVDAPQNKSVTVTLHNHSNENKTFSINKNRTFDWLTVHPSTGNLQAQGSLELVVSPTINTQKHLGSLPGAFLITFENGVSLPVSVYGETTSSDLSKVIQAEHIEGAKHFKQVTDSNASGNLSLDFTKDSNEKLSLKVNAPLAGNYHLYFRIKCPLPIPSHDSVFLKVNNGEKQTCHINGSSEWKWTRARTSCSLKSGENIVEIIPRETLFLDAIFISSRPLFPGERIE